MGVRALTCAILGTVVAAVWLSVSNPHASTSGHSLSQGGRLAGLLVAADREPKERRTAMDAVVAQAGASSGQEYLALEGQLRAGGQEAMAALRRSLSDPDPVNQLMASSLLARMEGRATDCEAAFEFLDALERRLAKTPVGNPPPVGVAAELDDRFGPRAAECLALRLVKEIDWPQWRVMGVLFYLRDQKVSATTSALVRFAASTPNPAWQKAAVEAIEAIEDPELRRKLDLESQRLASTRKALPEALRSLAP